MEGSRLGESDLEYRSKGGFMTSTRLVQIPVALISLSLITAPLSARSAGGSGAGRLAKAHTDHVIASVERLLATGKLSTAHEFATREGLDAFISARAGGQIDGVIDPALPKEFWSFEADSGLDQMMAQPSTSTKGLAPHPAGINSIGKVVCTFGDELLVNGRFVIIVEFQGFVGGPAVAYSCRMTNSAGYFFFFDPSNIEVPIKVLNVCAGGVPPGHWVFAAGLTNFAIAISVFDLFTGITKTYLNPLGNTFNTIIDQSTPFPCP